MTNTELPSIQHLLSSLEEPLQRPGYMLPALVLPNKPSGMGYFSSPASMQAPALSSGVGTASSMQPFQFQQQIPRQQPQLPPVKLESPPQRTPSPKTTTASRSRSSISSSDSSTSSHCSCKSHRRNPSHIPRPRNAFILFRQHFHYELFPKNESMLSTLGSFKTNSEISREIGQRWRRLSPEEKQYWHDLAQPVHEQKNSCSQRDSLNEIGTSPQVHGN